MFEVNRPGLGFLKQEGEKILYFLFLVKNVTCSFQKHIAESQWKKQVNYIISKT